MAASLSLKTLSAEFDDAALERRFRAVHRYADMRQAVVALLIGAFFNLAFGYNDYTVLGTGTALSLLLIARTAVSSLGVIAALALIRKPRLVEDGRLVTLIEAALFACFILIVMVRPHALAWHATIMTIIVLAVYLFIPNRFVPVAVLNLTASLLLLALVVLFVGPPLIDLSRMILLLSLANTIGLLTAHRFQRLRRKEYALLRRAESSNRRLREEVERRRLLEDELKRLATTDPLTGLANRRHFLELADQEIKRARRRGVPLAFCLLDVDDFKAINDRYGHAAGDETLRAVSEVLRTSLREVDIIGRYGGEEFTLCLPETTLQAAEEVAERVRAALADIVVKAGDARVRCTATFGLTEWQREENDSEPALHRADLALYEGKQSGRNRVVARTLAS